MRYNAQREHENNVIGRRIAKARQDRNLTLTQCSELLAEYGLDIKRYGINRWETGATVPNAYQLVALCHALDIADGIAYFTEHTDKQTELNDIGMKKLWDYKMDLVASGRYAPKAPSKIRYIEMPVSTLAVSAGTGAFLDEGNFEMVSFPESTVPQNAEFGIRVSGDSMEPVYQDGQIVWVQACQSLQPGEVGIFLYDGDGYVKRYEEQEPEEAIRDAFVDSNGVLHPQPVLVSYNQKYPPKPVSPELAFSIVGRVLN
jgi:transcriptional regulator with XRE-family HTH domain